MKIDPGGSYCEVCGEDFTPADDVVSVTDHITEHSGLLVHRDCVDYDAQTIDQDEVEIPRPERAVLLIS